MYQRTGKDRDLGEPGRTLTGGSHQFTFARLLLSRAADTRNFIKSFMQDKIARPTKQPARNDRSQAVNADLIAVVIAVTTGEPRVLTIEQAQALPSGPFELGHRSLQSGLRAWVERQTGHQLGYIEQLYTFADRDRTGDERVQISISYLGLTREEQAERSQTHGWHGWYDYFPWEDHRAGVPSILPDNSRAPSFGLVRRRGRPKLTPRPPAACCIRLRSG